MSKIFRWIFGIIVGLIVISWLLVGRSDRQAYPAARRAEREVLPTSAPTLVPTLVAGMGCTQVMQSPEDYTVFEPGERFTTTWELQNSGDTKWERGEIDIRFLGAAANVPLHDGSDVYDLDRTVEPGEKYNFSVSMIAPEEVGTFGEIWEIVIGNQQICQFSVDIEVD